ncbi:MAG: carbon monoxide dehydrogenase subunit G [Betaproteobacteria bacterium]
MEMTNTRVVDAPPDKVWAALNDPAVLKDAVPGCETLERVTDTEWRAVVAAKIGPVSARFNGKMVLADIDAPNGYTLKFDGQGGAAGFASGEARVRLAPADAGKTALSYTAKAQVGGKLAQIGSRLIDGAAAKMADDFFARFAQRLAPAPVAPDPSVASDAPAGVAPVSSPSAAPARGSDVNRVVRYVAIAAIVALLAWLALKGGRW